MIPSRPAFGSNLRKHVLDALGMTPDELRDQAMRAVKEHLNTRQVHDEIMVEIPDAPAAPSVVERLAAVEDEEIAERVREADEAVERHKKDVESGIMRLNATFRPTKPAEHIVFKIDVPPSSKMEW